MADQRRDMPAQQFRERVRRRVAAGDDHGHLQLAYGAANGSGSAEIGLGQAEHRREAAAYAATRQRSMKPVRGTGSATRRDDHQLVGVGDHHALDGVGVVGGAAQHGACARRCGRSGPGCPARRRGRPTSPTRSPTTIGRAAQLAGAHRGHRGRPGRPRARRSTGRGRRRSPSPSAASAWSGRCLVRGRVPRAGADPDVVSSYLLARLGSRWSDASMAAHVPGSRGGSWRCSAMSSTSTPGTTSPMIAPAVAIRWSA